MRCQLMGPLTLRVRVDPNHDSDPTRNHDTVNLFVTLILYNLSPNHNHTPSYIVMTLLNSD